MNVPLSGFRRVRAGQIRAAPVRPLDPPGASCISLAPSHPWHASQNRHRFKELPIMPVRAIASDFRREERADADLLGQPMDQMDLKRTRNRCSTGLVATSSFVAVFALLGAGPAQAETCLDNGVCWARESTGTVVISGQPRAGNYVTNGYNVRIDGGRQFHLAGPWSRFQVDHSGHVVSVQACRSRGAFRHSICTSWSSFRVY
jgi:hypothetical protein